MNDIVMFSDICDDLDKTKLGNKGANLIKMYQNGINVPFGFVITNNVCKDYFCNEKRISNSHINAIRTALNNMGQKIGKKLGDKRNPLILSIRSGAAISMPGMMNTILNAGISEEVLLSQDKEYLYKAYLSFMDDYVESVMNIDLKKRNFEYMKNNSDYHELILNRKEELREKYGVDFDDTISLNIVNFIGAIFNSWKSEKAKNYRELKRISEDLYTAVVIQEMRFGNYNECSGSGVVFTENPITHEKELYGEYMTASQGDAVVSGLGNPKSIDELKTENEIVYAQLINQAQKIEELFGKPQDIEFTFEDGRLYILQSRDIRI